MVKKKKSVLVAGFNTRPLAYSLNRAGYQVYVVDFFGDIDLYPYVRDSIIITKELGARYDSLKGNYQYFLKNFTLDLLEKHSEIENLIIASGLDDYIEERQYIINEVRKRNYKIENLNNDINTIKSARDIIKVYNILKNMGYRVPKTYEFEEFNKDNKNINYPIILKKKKSSGGINVHKIENRKEFSFLVKTIETGIFISSEWLIQDYIEGIPVSCTTISNGKESKIISINRQIIGLKFLNPPKEFMYCGNIVPGNLLREDNNLISEISIRIANKLRLKGINGFDFVLRNHYPYLMEINPRIPGSIRASEDSLNLNLLDLHIKSFNHKRWDKIVNSLDKSRYNSYVTKLIFFAPKLISIDKLERINNLKFTHDKNETNRSLIKGEPVCSILYSAPLFSNSFFGALKVVDEIKQIIS